MSSSVLGSFRRAREWAYPQLTSSAFLEKGVLTPEEFIIAGKSIHMLYIYVYMMFTLLLPFCVLIIVLCFITILLFL